MFINMLFSLLLPFLSFLITFITIPYIIKTMHKLGKVGIDIHKRNKPKIAEMGGLSIFISIIISLFILFFLENYFLYLIILLTGLITGLIGLVDDIKNLGGKIKPILCLLGGIPLLLTNSYNPHPPLPFISETRLTLIYPILIPIGIAIFSNAINMLNVINGATPLLLIPLLITLAMIGFISGKLTLTFICLILLGSLLAFYYYNKYPAKVFMGNVGDFFIGGIIGGIAIVYNMEIVVIVGMLPYIMHGFYVLSSLKGFFEKREIKNKPIIFDNQKEILYPSLNKDAPVTLLRFITVVEPMREKDIAKIFFIISIFSSILAFVTYLLTTIKLILI